MKKNSAFWEGVECLIKLDQQALNKWVKELFQYGLDTHFSDCLIGRDGYPSVAITDIFKASDKLKDEEFKKRLCLAVSQLVEDSLMLEPALIYDLLICIADNKITEVVGSMIKLIHSGQLKVLKYQDIDMHFQFLKFLATLYQHGEPNTPEGKLDAEIKSVLQEYLKDINYTDVCRAGLKRIKKKS